MYVMFCIFFTRIFPSNLNLNIQVQCNLFSWKLCMVSLCVFWKLSNGFLILLDLNGTLFWFGSLAVPHLRLTFFSTDVAVVCHPTIQFAPLPHVPHAPPISNHEPQSCMSGHAPQHPHFHTLSKPQENLYGFIVYVFMSAVLNLGFLHPLEVWDALCGHARHANFV
jgi:hypothetical protein